jgi:hypothetical protein
VSLRNLTITVDERVARWARVAAAERDMSLSRFVGEVLRERMSDERDYERAMRRSLARRPRPLKHPSDVYPKREELHERPVLRR